MVYCSKCGAQNEDEAIHCVNCGNPISITPRESRGWEEELEVRAEEFGERAEQFGKRMEEECFGLPGGNTIIGVLIGVAIILWGASEIMDWNLDLGPYTIIVFGLLIVGGVLYKQRQDKR
jgi:DNA-directed RNA polymerase subunit RPC12/RpoP